MSPLLEGLCEEPRQRAHKRPDERAVRRRWPIAVARADGHSPISMSSKSSITATTSRRQKAHARRVQHIHLRRHVFIGHNLHARNKSSNGDVIVRSPPASRSFPTSRLASVAWAAQSLASPHPAFRRRALPSFSLANSMKCLTNIVVNTVTFIALTGVVRAFPLATRSVSPRVSPVIQSSASSILRVHRLRERSRQRIQRHPLVPVNGSLTAFPISYQNTSSRAGVSRRLRLRLQTPSKFTVTRRGRGRGRGRGRTAHARAHLLFLLLLLLLLLPRARARRPPPVLLVARTMTTRSVTRRSLVSVSSSSVSSSSRPTTNARAPRGVDACAPSVSTDRRRRRRPARSLGRSVVSCRSCVRVRTMGRTRFMTIHDSRMCPSSVHDATHRIARAH